MLKSMKAPLTALMLSSVAMVPAATVAYVATADIAAAKSDKAGGGGSRGGGKSSSNNSKASGSKGKSGTKSASGGGSSQSRGQGGLAGFLDKLTGKDRAAASKNKAKSSGGAAKVAAVSPEEPPSIDLMLPKNLGKMNGPMNANVNALIAHIKNGNTNGPIGGMAALAVAGYVADGASETVALNEQFLALDRLLVGAGYGDEEGNADVAGYLAALEGIPGNDPIQVIEDVNQGDLTLDQALMAENNKVQTFADRTAYELWRDGVAGAAQIGGAEALIGELADEERPSAEDLEYADGLIEGRMAAEDYMLSIWNKGDGDDTVRSGTEDELLLALYDRLEADGPSLTGAIEEYADLPEPPVVEEVLEEDVTECLAGEDCAIPTGEEVAIASE